MNDEDNDSELVGLGRVGQVMRIGNIAVKTANIWTVLENASEVSIICNRQMNETNMESLKHEGRVYRHLGHVKGVIEPCHISDTEIQMPFFRLGSLDRYLRAHNNSIDNIQRLQWLRDAAYIVCRVHEQRVLVTDIATRNFLLNPDFSLQMCDFTESIIVLNNENMADFVSEDFFSVKFDIARFGSMMYEITSGSRYEFYVIPEIEADIDNDPESKTFKMWPTADRFPDTQHVFLGDIIRRCWLEDGFCSMLDICRSLDDFAQNPTASMTLGKPEVTDLNWRHILGLAGSVATSVIFAAIIAPRLPWRKILAAIPSIRH